MFVYVSVHVHVNAAFFWAAVFGHLVGSRTPFEGLRKRALEQFLSKFPRKKNVNKKYNKTILK